ncbi:MULTISPECIES: tubulin-like doman-containing protein [unclassified Paraburkholderia]|uniref:tubulin-like doman-containing protein n=1 Tax=unclassified Paraburkholderia TaxID=2615204 RepID=UPI002AAF8216|nr:MULTISPECIES: tubulin-like doman-containing protein [unclassified Paraburkholderia]
MSDTINQTIGADAGKQEQTIELRPTLFIGLGGTGMEVLMRVRRRILNTLWGGAGQRTRVDSLTDFPVAQFIQFDLDTGSIVELNRAQADDLQFPLVKFSDDEKIVETFDMDKYSRDDDALEKYPHVKEWLSLTPKKIRELGIDPAKGAGQIRAVSRLYLFDKYTKLRDKIRLKLRTLKAGLSHERQLAELGLRMETSKFRVVVVASVAGGTGSGAFLDVGLLSRWLAKTEVGHADVELMLFLPTGYADKNKDRTAANGYAALMELESAMMGNKGYVGRWDAYDQPELPREPYGEVYLIDSGNLAQQNTKDINDVYHMVADALFEDFASGDFARRKRSVAVNQAQHKNFLHDALVPRNRFADMRLSYSKRFSAFGHATLDTRQEARRDELAHRWAGAMLQAFFGVGSGDLGANRATDKQRDEFLAAHVALRPMPFSEFPEFSDKSIELQRSSGEFTDFAITSDLLQDKNGLLLAGIEQRVNAQINAIRSGFQRAEWPTHLREAMKQLERDAVRDQDSTADTTEDRVSKRRREIFERIKKTVSDQLYAYLDNKEFGGLEYVLSLVEQIKDRLEAQGTGLIAALELNAERYREIKEAVRSREYERLLDNLAQTRSGLFGLGGGDKQANTVLDHLRIEMANALKFHLRAKAASEAAQLMQDVSAWLGRKTGIDAQGRAVWSGQVGEFQSGRDQVLGMLRDLQSANAILQQDLTKQHSTLIVVPATLRDVPMPAAPQLREWADDAFKDIGGSKVLFPMLADAEQRSEILLKIKRMAERQLSVLGAADTGSEVVDPLLDALDQMSPGQRGEYFRKLLACAMPWIDANLGGDFMLNADQYKCFIGVNGADEFRRKFGAEIDASVPTHAGITPAQISIVETGLPGRAVCYSELSGVPMTVLRGLEGWRTSYRKESEKSPTHAHIDSTQFSHPMAPSTDEISRLAEDFKQYLLAIMLGTLTRATQRVTPPGQYQFAVARGDVRRIGNERAIRQNGLPVTYRAGIVNRVQEALADLDALQTSALAALCCYYETAVYTPKLVSDSTGAEQVRKGFASAIAGEAKRDLRDSARRKGVSEAELDRHERRLLDDLPSWASVIGDSDADAYDWEVREPNEDQVPRLKFALRPERLVPGGFNDLLQQQAAAPVAAIAPSPYLPMAAPAPAPVAPPPVFAPPPLVATPPGLPPAPGALPPVAHQYLLGINGQQFGPYNAQQVVQFVQAGQIALPATKVWRSGLAEWVELATFAELMGASQPQMMPPPLMPGAPPLPL